MLAHQHILFALLNRIHDLAHDIFCRRIIINYKWLPERHRQNRSAFLEFQSFLIKSLPESVYNYGNHYRFILFDDQRCPFSRRCKWRCCALGKSDHPVCLQGPCDLSCIRGIQSFSYFAAFGTSGSFHSQSPCKRKYATDPASFHRFFSRYIIDAGKWIQEIIWNTQAV
jgi:hypothetical protein